MTGQARVGLLFGLSLPAPLAGPADNVRSGATFATSGMIEMSDGRIRDHPEGHSAASGTTVQYNTREGMLSLLIPATQPQKGTTGQTHIRRSCTGMNALLRKIAYGN